MTIIPVILSGGSGSRLWPVSRKSYPKQFWPLIGEETPFQKTVLRARASGIMAPPIIVGSNEHRFIMAEQLRQVGIEDATIILEPCPRNSSGGMMAAAFLQMHRDPESILWFMPADAAIEDDDLLKEALEKVKSVAQKDYLVTFGIKPTHPETGYGYIKQGKPVETTEGAFHVAHFLEKPSKKKAEEFLKEGGYFWNSGMFIAKADFFTKEMEKYAPDIYKFVKLAIRHYEIDLGFLHLSKEDFCKSPDISIDYALAEKTKRAVVVPAHFKWMDVGSWDAVWELTPKDTHGNATHGDVFLDHAKNCYVHSENMIATVTGVDDLILIVTPDAVMVSHRDRAQDIKHMVARLKQANRSEAIKHRRMYRPWGFYEGLIQDSRFQVKRICVSPGEKLSLQKHYHRAEHWVVVAGTAQVTRGDETILLKENESIYIPLGMTHRLENPGKIPLSVIEVQSGAYLGEDDIVRFEDIYKR